MRRQFAVIALKLARHRLLGVAPSTVRGVPHLLAVQRIGNFGCRGRRLASGYKLEFGIEPEIRLEHNGPSGRCASRSFRKRRWPWHEHSSEKDGLEQERVSRSAESADPPRQCAALASGADSCDVCRLGSNPEIDRHVYATSGCSLPQKGQIHGFEASDSLVHICRWH